MEPEAIAPVIGADSDEVDNPRFEDGAQRASDIPRRSILSRVAFFGAAMAAIGSQALAQAAGNGSFSDAAVALPTDKATAKSGEEQTSAVKIARAMRSGPPEITKMLRWRRWTNTAICRPSKRNGKRPIRRAVRG